MIEDLKKILTDFKTSGKFLVTGLTGVIVDNAVLVFVHSMLGFPLALSKAASTESAILVNFAVNDNWTFERDEQPGTVWKRLVKSNSIRIIGLAISVLVILALNKRLGVPLIAANMMSIGAGFVFNYTLESFAWKMHEK